MNRQHVQISALRVVQPVISIAPVEDVRCGLGTMRGWLGLSFGKACDTPTPNPTA